MYFNIGIEDLAANALIEVLDKNENRKFLSYREIELYGAAVVDLLKKNNQKAVLILSRNNTHAFFKDYSNIFEEREQGGEQGIHLKDGVTVDILKETFRGYLSYSVLCAFMNKKATDVLRA